MKTSAFRSSAVLALIAASLFLGGCELLELTESDPVEIGHALIQTSKEVYTVERSEHALEVVIPITFENRTGQTTYINTCKIPSPPALQKWIKGQWRTVYSAIVLLCLGPPVVIDAGETYRYTFRMHASLRPNTYPKFEAEEVEGTYRLIWGIHTSYENGGPADSLLPLEKRVSNTFRLVR